VIIYSSDKRGFLSDMDTGAIDAKILHLLHSKTKSGVSPNEMKAWKNSLPFMDRALRGLNEVPDDAGISIEYQIPNCGKRVDFIITGLNNEKRESVIIIELKQWTHVEPTNLPSTVRVRWEFGYGNSTHPCYQAWSYACLIQDYNETVQQEEILLLPCAYLHNYKSDGVIDGPLYADDIERAPLFLQSDIDKLRDFIKKHIKYGDRKNILYRIDNGKIKPSKHLADHLASLIKGNPEFILIDEQKVAYETVLAAVESDEKKNVIIIEGGPGTGKTVLAINLLVELTKRNKVTQYVTKNAAPREVYQAKLAGTLKKTQISNLFVSSGSFVNSERDTFDALIVDEAHRLNERSGLMRNKGEHQIKEIIHAAKTSVFFIDEDQRVTIFDVGTKEEIRSFAMAQGAKIIELELPSQFRCNGSDGYLAWLDDVLQIRQTANTAFGDLDYDFKVFDDPNKLYREICAKNRNNKARLVAGYCWNWISKNNPREFDINLPEYDFKMRWNLAQDSMLWILKEDSIGEIGCIHTCQGLELEYVGVIVGPDLIVRNGVVTTNYRARARTDQSLKGISKLAKESPNEAQRKADLIIRNTYRTLMTRGTKGCYIFCTDQETREYFRSRLSSNYSDKYGYQPAYSKVAERVNKYGKG